MDMLKKALKDKKGRVVTWQSPNLPIAGWFLFLVMSHFFNGKVGEGLADLSQAFLFVWAYLELTYGVNLFRKILGALVMVYVSYQFFI